MVVELFNLVAEEIAAEPLTFAIEVVQFLILVALVWMVAWGFGKRRGVVRNMLSERQERVTRQLAEADTAEDAVARAREQAKISAREARKVAKHDVALARKQADAEFDAAKTAADREVEGMRAHAAELLALEREEMVETARERLLDVVGRATRYILSEGLSPAEQRSLIQHAIMESLDGDRNRSSAQSPNADPERAGSGAQVKPAKAPPKRRVSTTSAAAKR